MRPRVRDVAASVAVVVVAVSGGVDTGSSAPEEVTTQRDRALVEALAFHRSDAPSHWREPARAPFPCTPPSGRDGIDVSARKEAGWTGDGGTLIHRTMLSLVETTDAADALFRRRVSEMMKCMHGKRSRVQPGRLVDAPADVRVRAFHATARSGTDPDGFEIMVVRVDRAVAQYVTRYVQLPYRASALALVRRAVARGVAAA